MSKRAKLFLIVVATLLVMGSVVAWRPLVRACHTHGVHAVTSSLPSCDRVEVFHLDGMSSGGAATDFPVRPYGTGAYSRILDHKTLTGADAESLAALWRSQTFGWKYQALCHEPAYGFRFYRGSSLQFETSVAFNCNNFYVTVLGRSDWWGFDGKSPRAAELLKRLQAVFTPSVPNQKTK